jgi:mannose-6-phosphate isomerase-like protein (cupin superfamily)
VSEIFQINDLLKKTGEERRYHEFLRVQALSAGVYLLRAGATDTQEPHREDEIYYVLRGRAQMRLGTEERSVRAGDVIFVERGLEHQFFEIAEELALLVIFAPAESQ